MTIKRKYYWKDRKGKLTMSDGIELTPLEKSNLARKNLKLIKENKNNCQEKENSESS